MTTIRFRRLLFGLLIVVGVVLGIQHHLDAGRSLLSFPRGTPTHLYLAIYAGRFLTLPAVLVSLLSRRMSGWLLLFGSLATTVLAIALLQDSQRISTMRDYVAWVSLPMALLGLAFLRLARLGPMFRADSASDDAPRSS